MSVKLQGRSEKSQMSAEVLVRLREKETNGRKSRVAEKRAGRRVEAP